jgi:hypothetical protein
MKQLFTFVLLCIALSNVSAQSNVPGGNFENWHTVTLSASLNYEDIGTDPTDNWTSTLNSLKAVPASAGGPGPVTVFKTTDKNSGTYAAKAVSAALPLGPVTVFIPGMVGTATLATVGIKAYLGKPCIDCKPLKFKGYYKFEPVNGDSCAAIILLSKWNAVSKMRDTIGYGKMVQRNPVTTYTQFEIPVNYRSTGSVYSITLLMVSSAGLNVFNFMGCVGQVGNTMYVDDLMLEYPTGIEQVLMPEVAVKTYPNPASEVLNIELSKLLKSGSFEIYSNGGKLVGTYPVAEQKKSISTYNLSNGAYYYRLLDGKSLVNTGTFSVNR